MDRPDIAVIGAGIGGLTLALALRRFGIPVRIYEQAAELTEVGAAVALAANGTRILRDLGLGEALGPVSAVPSELVYRHWSDARPLATHPVDGWYEQRFGAPFWGIHRAHLQNALSTAWGTADLHLGRALVGLEERGGARSPDVRRRVDRHRGPGGRRGRDQVARAAVDHRRRAGYSGTSGFRGIVAKSALSELPDPDAVQFWMGPGAHLLHYAIGDVVNFLAVVEGPERWDAPGGMTTGAEGELAAAFAGWHPAVRQMVEAVPQSPRWGLFALPPLTRWARDGVVLLGDAAHAMLPHHGQGANQTIEDAAVLAERLHAVTDVSTALADYERLRRCRTRQVQRSSWVTSPMLHLPDGADADRRDRKLQALVDDFSWIHAYDHRAAALT